MSSQLPGNPPYGDLGAAVAKAVLRLAGGGPLADAIADLTGLGRKSVEKLSAQALSAVSELRDVEFTAVAAADREWAEAVLVRTYRRLATRTDLALARESLIGPESLATWAFGAGLSQTDRADLATAAEDVRAYYELVSLSMAQVVSTWYRTDQRAGHLGSTVALGAILETVREVLDRVAALEQPRDETGETSASSATALLIASGLTELALPPEYYPRIFDNGGLSSALRVVELDESVFFNFEGRGLYWDGRHWGEELSLTSHSVKAGELVVLLGNPGSGKSTVSKGLVLESLRSGRLALHCRLEDFARLCASDPGEPGAAAVYAFGQSVGTGLDRVTSKRLADRWEITGDRPLLVLDGLDELATAVEYANARDAAVTLARRGHPVIVTSRAAGYTKPWTDVTRHLALAPLSAQARDQFADSWFSTTGSEVARARYETATHDGALEEVLASPLTLGFVCMLAHYDRVPVTKGAVFNRFIDHFLRAPWRDAAMQRIDAVQIGQLKQYAEDVAWAMANYGPADRPTWVDMAELGELQRATLGQAAYTTYATGLLVPHGPVEPLGGTQQRARWLHRALHENFVAQRLRALVRQRDPNWRRLLLRASCHSNWLGALSQAFSLMNEGPELAVVMRDLEERIRQGDTPGSHLAWTLWRAADHATSADVRRQAALALLHEEKWLWAAQTDPTITVEAAQHKLACGRRSFDAQLWRTLYESDPPGVQDLLVEAHSLGCPNPELPGLVDWIALSQCGPDSQDRILDRLCADLGAPLWYVRPIPEPVRSAVVQGLARRLAVAGDNGRLSLIRAYDLWCAVVGDGAGQENALPEDRRLRLAVLLGRKRDNRDHDLRDVRPLMTEPLADEDAIQWGGPLQRQGFLLTADDPRLLAVAPVLYTVDIGFDEIAAQPVHLSDVSQSLALGILARALRNGTTVNWDRLEAIVWGLEVLRRRPTVEAILPLARFRRELEEGSISLGRWIDTNFLAEVIVAQPWHILALRIKESPTEDPSWDAQVLCSASTIAGGRSWMVPELRLPQHCIVEYYLEGLQRWATVADANRLPHDLLGYPENLDEPEVRRMVDGVLSLIAEGHAHLRFDLLWKLEKMLESSGFLEDHFEAVYLARNAK